MSSSTSGAVKRLHRELKELEADPLFTQDHATLYIRRITEMNQQKSQEDAKGSKDQDKVIDNSQKSIDQDLTPPVPIFAISPNEENFFDWHFSICGPTDSPYEQGVYHGRIDFPSDYPFSPPNFMFLTPNGRFETRTKICLSVTTFHRESWQPAWGIRTMLLAIREHFRNEDRGALGYISYSREERVELARRSVCPDSKIPCASCDIFLTATKEKLSTTRSTNDWDIRNNRSTLSLNDSTRLTSRRWGYIIALLGGLITMLLAWVFYRNNFLKRSLLSPKAHDPDGFANNEPII